MFERRRREEAEGESRIMGSGRRPVVGLPLLVLLRSAGVRALLVGWAGVGPLGRVLVRRRKSSACLRTWEKSCCGLC